MIIARYLAIALDRKDTDVTEASKASDFKKPDRAVQRVISTDPFYAIIKGKVTIPLGPHVGQIDTGHDKMETFSTLGELNLELDKLGHPAYDPDFVRTTLSKPTPPVYDPDLVANTPSKATLPTDKQDTKTSEKGGKK